MLIVIASVAVCVYVGDFVCQRTVFRFRVNEAIEHVTSGGGTASTFAQGVKIVNVLKNANIKSIQKPTIADARWIDLSDGGSIIAIDWLCSHSNVETVLFEISNGNTLNISFEDAFTVSNGWYYRQTIVSKKQLSNLNHEELQIKSVFFINENGNSNVVSVSK